jgi:hypothetical protein
MSHAGDQKVTAPSSKKAGPKSFEIGLRESAQTHEAVSSVGGNGPPNETRQTEKAPRRRVVVHPHSEKSEVLD